MVLPGNETDTAKIAFPVTCPKCRRSQSVPFSYLKHNRIIACPCGADIVIDRRTIGIVGKSRAAVHKTQAMLRRKDDR